MEGRPNVNLANLRINVIINGSDPVTYATFRDKTS